MPGILFDAWCLKNKSKFPRSAYLFSSQTRIYPVLLFHNTSATLFFPRLIDVNFLEVWGSGFLCMQVLPHTQHSELLLPAEIGFATGKTTSKSGCFPRTGVLPPSNVSGLEAPGKRRKLISMHRIHSEKFWRQFSPNSDQRAVKWVLRVCLWDSGK